MAHTDCEDLPLGGGGGHFLEEGSEVSLPAISLPDLVLVPGASLPLKFVFPVGNSGCCSEP